MLESFFVQDHVLCRLRSGPMGPHLPELAEQLTQQHYARRTGCILLRTADWLGHAGYPNMPAGRLQRPESSYSPAAPRGLA